METNWAHQSRVLPGFDYKTQPDSRDQAKKTSLKRRRNGVSGRVTTAMSWSRNQGTSKTESTER